RKIDKLEGLWVKVTPADTFSGVCGRCVRASKQSVKYTHTGEHLAHGGSAQGDIPSADCLTKSGICHEPSAKLYKPICNPITTLQRPQAIPALRLRLLDHATVATRCPSCQGFRWIQCHWGPELACRRPRLVASLVGQASLCYQSP